MPIAQMTLRNLRAPLALLIALPFTVAAQNGSFHCGANELDRMGALIEGHPERVQEIAQSKAQLDHFTANWQGDAARDDAQYTIPVVFHIIHNYGPENITDEQVMDAMRVLNEDYNKLNTEWPNVQPEFLDIVANVGITFKLAQLDPNGNCTNGITRTASTLTYQGDQSMKSLIQWPRNRYLNVWVSAGAGGAAGYSMYPSSVSGTWGAAADGIVILGDYVGSIGTSTVSHSHSLGHEVGHWLNLAHCWGDSNTPGLASNCGGDDGVADTPNTIGWTTCNLRGATCGSPLDNVENFMEYSYCSKMFTNGQKARILAALNSSTASRNNLWTPSNLALTGVTGAPQLCQANLKADKQVICAGGTVNFADQSYNGVTTWNWNFQGGSPATATAQAPMVTYDTPGTYDVGLTVGNGSQTLNTQRTQYIVVLPNMGTPLPFSEGFEATATIPSAEWMVNDVNQDGSFQINNSAAATGSKSLRLINSSLKSGNVDELISNTIDMSTSGPATISFRYAFAKRTNADADALRLYISKDCGETWALKRALSGSTLTTAPVQGGSFTPNGQSQWGVSETSPISGDYLTSNLRIKFWFQSGGGNNLWLDDINILGTTSGIDAQPASAGNLLNVVPNPAGDRAEVVADLLEAGPVKVQVLDLLGQPVREVANDNRAAGTAKWNLDLSGLPSGLYLVRVQQKDAVRVARFTRN